MDIPGGVEPQVWEQASQRTERLAEELRSEIDVQVRDASPLRKELTITIPAALIERHLEENYRDLRSDAVVPGFRRGRAPLPLIEKRFGSQVRDSLKTTLVVQAFYAATEREKLAPLGDPVFQVPAGPQAEGTRLVDLDEALTHLRLEPQQDLRFVCEVEVKPEFDLPDLDGIEVRVPRIEITDRDVEEEILRQRKIRGRLEPLAAPAEPGDLLIADLTLEVDGQVIRREENVELGLHPARVAGIPVTGLAEALRGVQAGQQRALEVAIPADYERTDLRGRPGRLSVQVHEVKRLVPAPLETVLHEFGAQDETELREFVRQDLEGERQRRIRQAQRQAVLDYLLARTEVPLPPELAQRQVDRALLRRVVALHQAGVPEDEIRRSLQELQSRVGDQVRQELKLEFILEKVAEQLEVEVTDEEVNAEIARMARAYGRRFDRTRDELARRGLLEELARRIRDDKCVDRLLQRARIVESPAETAQEETT